MDWICIKWLARAFWWGFSHPFHSRKERRARAKWEVEQEFLERARER